MPSANDLPLLDRGGVDVVPNIPWPANCKAPYVPSLQQSRILWVGSFNHEVNLVGLDRFIERVWPRIVQGCPKATLCIVGSSLPDKFRDKWSRYAGTEILGFVDDLSRVYSQAAFSIVPLWDGAGTKIKVLESLAYGRTVLAAKHSVRGFEEALRHKDSLWTADDEDGLVEGALVLLEDGMLRHRLERSGQDVVRRVYGFDSFARNIEASVARISGDG